MSFLERTKGMPYGGIQYDELLDKLEETKMPESNYEENYDKYIRSEIVDWSLDPVLFESDHSNRDGTISKTQLNLRYSGSRGSQEYPKHPEVFIGFMDQDNRSLDNNPRMNEYKKQIDTRANPIKVRMGFNNTDHISERPWSNASINDCMRDIQTSMKTNTKVFSSQFDGMPTNQNIQSIYDHNKQALLYKDILPPYLVSNDNTNFKQNNKYTFTSVPLVSHDAPYSISRTNYYPSTNTIISTDLNDLKNICDDRKILELISETNNAHLKYTPINNHNLLENDGKLITLIFDSNVNKKMDNFPIQNNNLTDNNLIINNVTNNKLLNKNNNICMKENNNNLTSFSVYVFQDIDNIIKKLDKINLQPSVIDSTIHDYKFKNQKENDTNSNKFIFSDDIQFKLQFTNIEINDKTKETKIYKRNQNKIDQDSDLIKNEVVWKFSNENNVLKNQKHIRTSVTDDKSIINVPENINDKNIYNKSSILGKKSIRGDHINDNDSNIYDLI